MALSPYQIHFEKWKNCTRCPLHEGRNKVVFARGQVPCDVLFVGEAPGTNENASGLPFDGPAGIKLDEIISQARYHADIGNGGDEDPTRVRIGYYNLVSCFPRKEKEEGTNEPPKEAIRACSPKLKEFVRIAKPRLIVLVGKLVKQNVYGQNDFANSQEEKDSQLSWIPRGKFLEFCEIVHPAAILRAPVAQQSLMVKQSILRLAESLRKI